jgi:hypothetical protein
MRKISLLALFLFAASPPNASAAHAGVVTSFTLINAETNKPIAGFDPMSANAVLNFATLPTNKLNIRANTIGTTQSVRFGYDAKAIYRTENVSPYAFDGDTNGDYYNWTPTLGVHTVTARPYSADGAGGSAGALVSIAFTVTNQTPVDAGVPPDALMVYFDEFGYEKCSTGGYVSNPGSNDYPICGPKPPDAGATYVPPQTLWCPNPGGGHLPPVKAGCAVCTESEKCLLACTGGLGCYFVNGICIASEVYCEP